MYTTPQYVLSTGEFGHEFLNHVNLVNLCISKCLVIWWQQSVTVDKIRIYITSHFLITCLLGYVLLTGEFALTSFASVSVHLI